MKNQVKLLCYAISLMAIAVSCGKEPSQPTVAVSGVTLSPESLDIEIGDQKPLTVTVSPSDATNKNVSFSSSEESVAAVTQDGIVKAKASGKAIVTVTTEDGKYKAHCTVNVLDKIVHVTGIALNKTTLSLKEGEEFTLIPTVTPDNAADKSVSWSCDNEAVVTVSDEGVVKALKAGKAIVTATTVDQSKAASCSIEVEEGMSAITGAAAHISCRNAEISGKANLPGTTSTDLSFGVLYSTSSGVLIGSATQIKAKSFDSDYNYTIYTEVLDPETTYYYRSYIIQDKEISYGELKSFTTLAVSSMIQTLDATDINPKDAVLNASLDLTDCKYDALEYGFEITPEGSSSHTIKSSNHSEKKFSAKDESLSRDTKYSVVAYVKLDGRTYKGEAKTFSTTSVQASVTAESSNVSYYSATISGKLTVESEGSFTKSAELYYSSTASTLEALKSSGIKKTLSLGSDGSYSIDLTSLESNTQYNYVVIAKVDEIELKTEVKTFKTSQIVASVTAESSNVSCNSATISGSLTVESEGSFTKSAVLYYSSTASTLEGLKSSGTKKTLTLGSDGSYSIGLTSLESNTQFNYVVIAKVDEIEFKTEVNTFKTLQIVASVTAESSNVSYHDATISGRLTVESEGSFTKSAVLYYSSTASTLAALKSSGTKKTLTLSADGSYSIGLTSLESNTQYNYVVIAKVDEIEFKTEVNTFKTLQIVASVTAESSNLSYHSATISGKLTVESEGSFTKSATLYYNSTASTLEALKSSGTKMTITLGADDSYSINISSLVSDTQYNYVVVSKVDEIEFNAGIKSFQALAPPSGSVDLGLSVLWSTCNLGAYKPEDYGGYYQWAGTTDVTDTKIYLDWSNCPYHTGSSSSTGWTKYIPSDKSSYWSGTGSPDNKTVLDPEDDVAHVKLGGKWRMPTIAEWDELRNTNNCFWIWTSINGIKGYKVRSKKAGFTGNWIFLPAAGDRDNDYLGGSSGYYWSSSLNADDPSYAYNLYFYSYDVYTVTDYDYRYRGLYVRPVSE